jgi:hypothetical protein
VGRISNAWRIAQASWRVLSKDRELMAVPVVAGVAALVAFGAIALPGYLLLGGSDAVETSNIVLWIVTVLAVVAATWVSAIGQAAVVAGAAERMDGGDPDLSSAYAAARARAGRLLEWALLATVVAIVLDQIEQRLGILGRIVSWIGSVAFGVLSFLALPVILFEDVGAIEAFKRSSALVRRTWGEQVTFNFGLGVLGMLVMIPGVALGALLVASGVLPLQAVGVVALVVWVVAVAAVTSALSAVFKAALYRWANGLAVDPAFDDGDFSNAFRHRGR